VQEKMLFHVQYRSEPQQVHFYTQEQQFYPHLREKTKHRKNEGENMSNGTKVILGLIVFALGMLIMVSAFCPPSCTVRLITRQHRKTKATGEL